jgi:hypothetical protein
MQNAIGNGPFGHLATKATKYIYLHSNINYSQDFQPEIVSSLTAHYVWDFVHKTCF